MNLSPQTRPNERFSIRSIDPQTLGWFASLAILVSLAWSPAVGSMGMGLLMAAALWQFLVHRLEAGLGGHPLVWVSIAIYLLSLAAGFTTSNQDMWLSDLRQKLWFLLIPLAFAVLPSFTFRQLKNIIMGMLVANSVVALLSLINYARNFTAIQMGLAHQKSVPVVGNFSHIYFAVIMAVSVLAAIWLLIEERQHLSRWDKLVIGFTGLFLLISIHIFVSRTGYLALYSGVFAFFFLRSITRKQWKPFLIALLLLAMVPVASYFLIPSFRMRMAVTIDDVGRYRQENRNLDWLSVSSRFIAMEAAWQIYLDNPVFGTGIGDLETEIIRVSKEKTDRIRPENLLNNTHNQYLEYMAGFGTIGLLLLLSLFGIAFFQPDHGARLFLQSLVVMIAAACLFESLLERQAGMSLILLLLFILTGYRKNLA